MANLGKWDKELESTVEAKRKTVGLTKSIIRLTSNIIKHVPKEKINLVVEYYTEINELMQMHEEEIGQIMDDIYEVLEDNHIDKTRHIRVNESLLGDIEVLVGNHEKFTFKGIAKDKHPPADEEEEQIETDTSIIDLPSLIDLDDESDDYLFKPPDLMSE